VEKQTIFMKVMGVFKKEG